MNSGDSIDKKRYISTDTADGSNVIETDNSIEENQIDTVCPLQYPAEEGSHVEPSLLVADDVEVELINADNEGTEEVRGSLLKTEESGKMIICPCNGSVIDCSSSSNGRNHTNTGEVSKNILSLDLSGVFNHIHPGSLSRTIVELPGSAAARDDLEDIDDFSLHSEVLMKELEALEAGNYLRLQSLSEAVETSSQLSVVRERRRQIGEIINVMYKQNEYEHQTGGMLLYKNKPPPPPLQEVSAETAIVPPLLLLPTYISSVTTSNILTAPDSTFVAASEPVTVTISECKSDTDTVTVSATFSDTVNDFVSDPTLVPFSLISSHSSNLPLSPSSPSVSLNPAPFLLPYSPSLSEILPCSDSMVVSEHPDNTLSQEQPHNDGAGDSQTPVSLIYSPPVEILPSTLPLAKSPPVTLSPFLPLVSELETPCFPPPMTSPLPLTQSLSMPFSSSTSPPLASSLSLPVPLSLPILELSPAPYQSR